MPAHRTSAVRALVAGLWVATAACAAAQPMTRPSTAMAEAEPTTVQLPLAEHEQPIADHERWGREHEDLAR